MYGDFALVYDRLMADVDYAAWGAHYLALLRERGVPDGALVLEAACGTGSLSLRLARHYALLPGDISEAMLSVAAKKARDAGLRLTFTKQDMRSLRAHKQVDAIVSGCDGVNYLLTPAALGAFLKSANASLKPGGCLAFDVSSPDKLRRVLGGAPQLLRGEDICYIWENAWDEARGLLHLSLSIFVEEAPGSYRRIEEEQTQRAWTQQELTAAMTEAGFTGVRCYANFSLEPPLPASQRLHFSAVKA